MESLVSLEHNLQELLQRYSALQQQNQALHEELGRAREEIIRSHSELDSLRRECHRLRTANAIAGDPETRAEAYSRLTQMIRQVDSAIEVLKQ